MPAVGSDLFLGFYFLGAIEQLLSHRIHGLFDAALDAHGVGAGSHVAQAFPHKCLSQNGSGGGAVTCHVVGLLGYFFDQLGADLLIGFFEFNFPSDGHTVVGDGGGAPALLQHHIAALGAKGDLNCVCQCVETAFQAPAGFLVKGNNLCHGLLLNICSVRLLVSTVLVQVLNPF